MESSVSVNIEDIKPETDSDLRQWKLKRFIPTVGFYNEIKETWRLSWVFILIQLCVFAMQPITTMFGGHLGKLELDALALVNSMINIVGWSTLTGFSSVCDTYFSQSFGAKNYKLMGIYLQRCLIMHGFLLCVLFTMAINIGHFLTWAGQDAAVVELTSQYMLIFSPALIAMTYYIVFREFIYTQNIVYPDLYISASALVLHIIIQYVNFVHTSFELIGSAVGQVIVSFYMLFATLIYVKASGMYKMTWSGWSIDALLDWKPVIALALHGTFIVCFEWWAFEITIFLAGILGTTQLAAQSIVSSLCFLLYAFGGGLGSATAIRVGWYLGANCPKFAVTASSAGFALVGIIKLLMCSCVLIFREQIPSLFTDDTDVITLTSDILYLVILYIFFDGFATIGRGIIRGTGMQKLGTIVVFISYYCIGLPISIPLIFLTDLDLYGIWYPYTTLPIIGTIIYIILVYYVFNWQKLAANAHTLFEVKNKQKEAMKDETTHLISGKVPQYTSHEKAQDIPKITKLNLVLKILIALFFFAVVVVGIILCICFPIGNKNNDILINSNITVLQ